MPSPLRVRRGTRAALNALATANGIVASEPYYITDEQRFAIGTAVGSYVAFAKQSEVGGGGVDPWTRLGLDADFINGTTTFQNITGFTFTPPANTTYTIEAELIIETVTATNLPRIGVAVGAGQAYGTVEIVRTGTTDAAQVTQYGGYTTAAVNVQQPVGDLPAANIPRFCRITVKGRSGATPGAITLQLAAETAATNAVRVRVGSEMRFRTGP